MSKILVTSALPYINGVPHLGHMVGCLLPSDIYARFMRMMGNEVLYIGGTDEHGTTSEVGALKAGMDIRDYCDMYHKKHAEIYKDFRLSFDCFGRTSSEENKEAFNINLIDNIDLLDNEIIISKTTADKYKYKLNDIITIDLMNSKYESRKTIGK